MPLDAEVASQMLLHAAQAYSQEAVETRGALSQIARQRAAHVEEIATHISNTQTNLQTLYGATSANLLTGISNAQANAAQAQKLGLMFPYPIDANAAKPGG